MSGILAITEVKDGAFRKVSFEIVSEAIRCAKELGAEVTAAVIGTNVADVAGDLGKYGVKNVIIVDDAKLENSYTQPMAEAIEQIIKAKSFDHVFMPATLQGKALSAITAARFQTSAISDCVNITCQSGELIYQRPVYSGKAITTVKATKKPAFVSLRPNVFPATEAAGEASVEKMDVTFSDKAFNVKITNVEKAAEQKLDLTEASIIVSGGRGMKEAEHFNLIEDLASALGGVNGASRAVVDAGWRPHNEQVGQTGKTVSPQLYIACGISGAIQHLAGMRTSKIIVAINKDKDAPIFQVADYGIAGDVFDVLPAMIEEAKKLNN